MSEWIVYANSAAVGIFGGVLSASFCNAFATPRSRRSTILGIAVLLAAQGIVGGLWDTALLRDIYPLVTHLPLALLLCALTKQRLWPFIAVLTAYLCCQLRRWIAMLVAALLGGGAVTQAVVELAVTLPLLLTLLRFVAPAIRSMAEYPFRLRWQFGLIPLLYYGFDYLARVYTDLLARGVPAAVEFMPFVSCIAYLWFLLRTSAQERKRFEMEQTQNSLNIQMAQSLREIAALRDSQRQASVYRHDLRHHLQYLAACMENGQTEQGMTYIHGICAEIERQKVQAYCENEAANLILSAFAARAEKCGVAMDVQTVLPPFLILADSDLCVLLSNALENALHACQSLPKTGERPAISVRAYEKGKKLFLQVSNPCGPDVALVNGVPVTDQPGHGIGVRSICAIVEKYGGIYAFSVQDGRFILRLSI